MKKLTKILASVTAFALIVQMGLFAAYDINAATKAGASSSGTVSDGERIAAFAKPATSLVYDVINATVLYPEPDLGYLEDGSIGFIATDLVRRMDAQTGFRGTGFMISEDGYLLTNAHVARPDDETLVLALLSDVAAQIEAGLEEELSTYANLPEDLTELLRELNVELQTYFVQNSTIESVDEQTWVIQGVPVLGELEGKGLRAEVVEIGEPTNFGNQKDVALLKVEKKGLPTVELVDDSDEVTVGEQIFAFGYPGAADLDQSSLLEASLTSGVVSARKKHSGADWEVLQIDATLHPGNSGGPSFNSDGKVVGLNTFGAIDRTTGGSAAGVNYVVPTNVAKEFMQRSNVENKRGEVDAAYEDGLKAYWEKKCTLAKEKFARVKQLYAEHPFVDSYDKKCQEIIDKGENVEASTTGTDTTTGGDKKSETKTTVSNNNMLLYGGIGVGALVIIILIVVIMKKKGGKGGTQTPQPPQAPQPPTQTPQPPQAPQPPQTPVQ